jgi:hypothetical protein
MKHIPFWLLRLLPMFEYICPRCKREVKANSHECPHCGEKYPSPLKIPPTFLKDPKKLEVYVHEYVFPRISKFERNYLTQFFTTFLTSGWENSGGTDVTDGGLWTAYLDGLGSTESVVSSPVHSGQYALHVHAVTSGGYGGVRYTFSVNQATAYTRAYVYIESGLPNFNDGYCAIGSTWYDGNNQLSPVIHMPLGGGNLQWGLYTVSGGVTTWYWEASASNPTTGQWYCMEWTRDVANQIVGLWVDGVSKVYQTGLSMSNNNHGTNVDVDFVSNLGPAVTADFDDAVIADGYIGPITPSAANPLINWVRPI